MYNEGNARFQVADYNAAIDLWTEAFFALPDTPEHREQRGRLLYEMAHAHTKAYELDSDLVHVRKAKSLYEQFLQLADPDDQETHKLVAERQRQLDDILAKQTAEDVTPPRDQPPPSEPEVQKPEPIPEPASATPPPKTTEFAVKMAPKTRQALVIAGGISTGVGAGLLALMVLGIFRGNREMTADGVLDGAAADRLAVGAGISGGILLATGISMLAIGRARPVRLAFAPKVGPSVTGLQIRGRF